MFFILKPNQNLYSSICVTARWIFGHKQRRIWGIQNDRRNEEKGGDQVHGPKRGPRLSVERREISQPPCPPLLP